MTNDKILIGYKMQDFIDGGKAMADQLRSERLSGEPENPEWIIVGDIAVYTPYIPLKTTPNYIIKNYDNK